MSESRSINDLLSQDVFVILNKKAGDRLFLWGEGWFNTKKSWFNGKSGGRIWKVIIFDISLQRKSVVSAPKFVPKNVICLNINDICMKRKIEQLLLQWKQNPNR